MARRSDSRFLGAGYSILTVPKEPLLSMPRVRHPQLLPVGRYIGELAAFVDEAPELLWVAWQHDSCGLEGVVLPLI